MNLQPLGNMLPIECDRIHSSFCLEPVRRYLIFTGLKKVATDLGRNWNDG